MFRLLAGLFLTAPLPASRGEVGEPPADHPVFQSEGTLPGPPDASAAADQRKLIEGVAPVRIHLSGVTESELRQDLAAEERYRSLLRQKTRGDWFAALVDTSEAGRHAIRRIFSDANVFAAFLRENEVAVEVRVLTLQATATQIEAGAGGVPSERRLTAGEAADLEREPRPPPTVLMVTHADPATGEVYRDRVEFGLNAARDVHAMRMSYHRHRTLLQAAHELLNTRNSAGQVSATAQWTAIMDAVREGRLPLENPPAPPTRQSNPFVAFEFSVDEWGNLDGIVRAYRERDIQRSVVAGNEFLMLRQPDGTGRIAEAWRESGDGETLVRATATVAGADVVELRVADPSRPDPRRRNVLEFGEPDLLAQTALARYGLLNAHMIRHRKRLALKKSRLDLFAEPVFAGLNIGGGLSGLGFPIGEAGRLFYNVAVNPWFLPKVPSVDEMRALLGLLAAKKTAPDPSLRLKPARLLDATDVRALEARLATLTGDELEATARGITDEDLEAMLKLARFQNIDAKYRLFVDILTDAAKVSGESEAGILKDIFNSTYFSVNGDVSIKNILAAVLGEKIMTPLAGVSLEQLADGDGPTRAWAQFFDVTVDIRAVANSVKGLFHRNRADKLLRRPFPHAPTIRDLAAYEFRIFGYPLLIFYKRGLIKDDYAAYQSDYAYAITGTRIVKRFPSRASFEREIRAGTMVPLGLVRVPNGQGGLRNSRLTVFGHTVQSGRHAGKLAIVLYGMKAYQEYSELMERQFDRFQKFQQALVDGAVIEHVLGSETDGGDRFDALEPRVQLGQSAVDREFSELLADLIEWRHHRRLEALGLPGTDPDTVATLRAALERRGVDLSESSGSPLLFVDRFHSSFVYRRRSGDTVETVKLTLIPGARDVERSVARSENAMRIESARRRALAETGNAVIYLNEARRTETGFEIGPLLASARGDVIGHGVRADPESQRSVLAALDELPVARRIELERAHFSGQWVRLSLEGEPRHLFLSIEFPPRPRIQTTRMNPLTGQSEVHLFENGQKHGVVSRSRITRISREPHGIESASRTWFNVGTLEHPVAGPLLEETVTTDAWIGPRSTAPITPEDLSRPRIRKVRLDYVTGAVSANTHGGFEPPVLSVDGRHITRREFDVDGRLVSAIQTETLDANGSPPADPARPPLEILLNPSEGPRRFELVAPPDGVGVPGGSGGEDLRTILVRKDLMKGVQQTMTFDAAGRLVSRRHTESVGGQSIGSEIVFEYDDGFAFGVIPARSEQRNPDSNQVLSRTRMTGYDPGAGTTVGVVTTHSGAVTTNTWTRGVEVPVRSASPLRVTRSVFDSAQTRFTSETRAGDTGELISEATGEFRTDSGTWRVVETRYHDSETAARTEETTLSPFGTPLATRLAANIVARRLYRPSGVPLGYRIETVRPDGTAFDPPRVHLIEEAFEWIQGTTRCEVRRFIDGTDYDSFQRVRDSEGRIVRDDIRVFDGLNLETRVTYGGASDRIVESVTSQNGVTRVIRRPRPAVERGPDGVRLLVDVTPAWGPPFVERYPLDDPFGRRLSAELANGERIEPESWRDGLNVARVAVTRYPDGRLKERATLSPAPSRARGFPCDLLERQRFGFLGNAGRPERSMLLRGTDVLLRTDRGSRRIWNDLSLPFSAPLFETGESGIQGRTVTIRGATEMTVTRLFNSRVATPDDDDDDAAAAASDPGTAGPYLETRSIDLNNLFQFRTRVERSDPEGNIRLRVDGFLQPPREVVLDYDSLVAAAERVSPVIRHEFQYDTGWLTPQPVPDSAATAAGSEAPDSDSDSDSVGPAQELLFTATRPIGPGADAIAVNAPGAPDFLTGIRVTDMEQPSPMALVEIGRTRQLLQFPRQPARNSFFPNRTDLWQKWTRFELDSGGNELFRTEMMFDGLGRAVVEHSVKQTGRDGIVGHKIVYYLHDIPFEVMVPFEPDPNDPDSFDLNLDLDSGNVRNVSRSDFLYFFLDAEGSESAEVWLEIADDSGDRVRVGNGPGNDIRFWEPAAGNDLWLPDAIHPERGVTLIAADTLHIGRSVFAVAVPTLARAGVDIRAVVSARLGLRFASAGSAGDGSDGPGDRAARGPVSVSPLFRLDGSGPFSRDDNAVRVASYRPPATDHFGRLTVAAPVRTEKQRELELRKSEQVRFDGLPVLQIRSVNDKPVMVVFDHSDPDRIDPLYAVSPVDGRFLEHYRVLNLGPEKQVYTIVHGFAMPRVEAFRLGRLEDETGPGFIAIGYDYHVGFRNLKGKPGLGHLLAQIQNRIAANVFTVGGDRWLRQAQDWAGRSELTRFHYSMLHDARIQSKEIDLLPTVSELVLPLTPLPWKPSGPGGESDADARARARASASASASASVDIDLELDRGDLALELHRLQVETFPRPGSGLIPTAIGTRVGRYVDTVAEAELIQLAMDLGEPGLAGELLLFYWDKSRGGQMPLHASYDGISGTALSVDPASERPRPAVRNAESQLAVAEAAFRLGLTSRDPRWATLGRNLVDLVMTRFRNPEAGFLTRGIKEFMHRPVREAYGLTFWPTPDRYQLRTNARAYLLLKQLLAQLEPESSDPNWLQQIRLATGEQERWLRSSFLPHAGESGIVPNGLFQIQEIRQSSTALAPERWTSAEDWLWFLEAARVMGLPQAQLDLWLENLARAHGRHLTGAWGLDWNPPLVREPLTSPALTARFAMVADRLNHGEAARFARSQLGLLAGGGNAGPGTWNVAVGPGGGAGAGPALALTGQGAAVYSRTNGLGWPVDFRVAARLLAKPDWGPPDGPSSLTTPAVGEQWRTERTDLTVFVIITAVFYLSVFATALFWWRFRALRRGKAAPESVMESFVPEDVLRRSEERWAKRVLGVQTPGSAEHTRFSNGAVEQNFLMQLRAIYKLVIAWRRQENGWAPDDSRLADGSEDAWLNGLDEFAALTGIYMRYVIKAGAKDGFRRDDPLDGNEDSNHIWSRLVMYFSEHHWALLTLTKSYNSLVRPEDRARLSPEITGLLAAIGIRRRYAGFDARVLFDYPRNPDAMDLLVIQQPDATLRTVMDEASRCLDIPAAHIRRFVGNYKAFKDQEEPYPIHPYLIEYAKLLPHFLLMGLGAIVWYNQGLGDSPIGPYLWETVSRFALSPVSLLWGIPLLLGLLFSLAGRFTRVYRFEGSLLRVKAQFLLDATVTSFFSRDSSVLSKPRTGRWWKPRLYERLGWAFRAAGFFLLGMALLRLETPSFATFLVVKGLLAMIAFMEVAAVALPIVGTVVSKWIQDFVSRRPDAPGLFRFLNQLNITATQPASPLALSARYHLQSSVPSGTPVQLAQAVGFYFVLAAAFFFVGGFLCQQIFSLWFTDTYLAAANWKFFLGGLVFWNTMYLLRYGLFVLITAIAGFFAAFPAQCLALLLALIHGSVTLLRPEWISASPTALNLAYFAAALLLAVIWVHPHRREARDSESGNRAPRRESDGDLSSESDPGSKGKPPGTLGVVYMSGDDLSHRKLSADVLIERWSLLRNKFDSSGLRLLHRLSDAPDADRLRGWFDRLHRLESEAEVTLWHPSQLFVHGNRPAFDPELGLNIETDSESEAAELTLAWHIRRWLVTMMSSAGHAQDTAVTLVDIALRLRREGLAGQCAFYLIQNKYNANPDNRPVQTPYDSGELAHRNKLARLLRALAPGCRAYSVHNWTPFGFKAGGMTGMDLVHEELLELSSMVVLDRNATVHDLDAFMDDLLDAWSNPEIIIVVPGRGTTNTRTRLGQASQLVEEGHRAYLKGLMSVLGGGASEAVGTGWGNILAVYYGKVQRTMVDPDTPKMPLTSRMQRGSSFDVKREGLIGFGPHAVGISEDTWAVSQTMHNAVALGARVQFRVSTAIWHKIRETWSHAEWLASFPRWSGGYLQMMHDPIMQRVNDFGPASVFAKEIRANSGRNFLTAPFALLNILLLPLAILIDVTPFVQILIVLWNFGLLMNQVLTLHGLNACLEATGFNRTTAVIGAVAGGLIPWLLPNLVPLAPGILMGCFLYGGFLIGFHRWLFERVRDILLFGSQLVLHALGQVMRQTMEFVASGAAPADAKGVNMAFRTWVGPREDRPLDRYPHFLNLRTIVWCIGLPAVLLNVFAMSKLDMLNVLLLIPSLMFSVSIMIGPFLMKPDEGNHVGWRVLFPKIAGWLLGIAFYTVVSLGFAAGGWLKAAAVILFTAVFAFMLSRVLRFGFFRLKLRRLRSRMTRRLIELGLQPDQAPAAASGLMAAAQSGEQAVDSRCAALPGLNSDARSEIARAVRAEIGPELTRPGRESLHPRFGPTGGRLAAAFCRSWTLSLFVLIWFFIVPVPGLLVFTAGDYRVSLDLYTLFILVCGLIGWVVAGSWIARGLEWIRSGRQRGGLMGRADSMFRRFRAGPAATDGGGSEESDPADTAGTWALFTDLATYTDQGSLAFAGRTLDKINATLDRSEAGKPEEPV